MGNSVWSYTILMISSIPFYYCTLEELLTGEMYLPSINGAEEGLFLVGVLLFFGALFGNIYIYLIIIFYRLAMVYGIC